MRAYFLVVVQLGRGQGRRNVKGVVPGKIEAIGDPALIHVGFLESPATISGRAFPDLDCPSVIGFEFGRNTAAGFTPGGGGGRLVATRGAANQECRKR